MLDGDLDPALFGLWPLRRAYGEGLRADMAAPDEAMLLILDRKTADVPAGEDLLDMLNGMTRELREQMQMFQMLRRQADRRTLEAGEEIDRKTAQADAKASIEAMSLIVRTLEKIDSLQRTLAQDRERADGEALDDAGYQALLGKIEALVDSRAAERTAVHGAATAEGSGGQHDPGG
jgi:hypothetical protein